MTESAARFSWREAFRVYTRWPVLVLWLLGFSAGLPFLLVFSTLNARLADVNVATTTIGFFSWLGITYSIKVLWAPVVDRLPIPVLGRWLGQRRSWMLLAQAGIALGLWQMSLADPHTELQWLALMGLLVAFSSATQDVAIDAYRIEIAETRYQAAMSAAYIFGYRLALLVAGAGALYLAEYWNWTVAYAVMAALVGVGMLTVLLAPSPTPRPGLGDEIARHMAERVNALTHLPAPLAHLVGWFSVAVAGPFVDFFQRFGRYAITILALVAVYRISDIAMGVMANPFYLKFMGFSKIDVANVTKIFGFGMTIAGSAVGGLLVVRYGVRTILVAGAIMTAFTNLLFVGVAQLPPDLLLLAIAVSVDNLSGGLASVALIAWLSGMTSRAFTATQYALFSSLMTLPGKFIGGFSGMLVDWGGYEAFFLISALLGVPAIVLAAYLRGCGDAIDRQLAECADDDPGTEAPQGCQR
ncbi:MAG: AmpG family muropeptide MFS transporter [Gammaproteobacteria bacterium]|nr:AmpG family muropeptide MFS transporter [Gammaproteobacteria bacterium]